MKKESRKYKNKRFLIVCQAIKCYVNKVRLFPSEKGRGKRYFFREPLTELAACDVIRNSVSERGQHVSKTVTERETIFAR